MLKIKDNVDLKELEKFGFKPHYRMKNEETGEVYIDYFYSTKYEARFGYIRLRPKRKILWLWLPSRIFENHIKSTGIIIENEDYLDADLLYDLIQAGLVEKVEE